VLLKDTDTMNELSRYRYDVILTADQPADCIEFETLDSLSPAAVLKILANRSEGALRISGLPNPRVAHDCRAVEILTGDESIQTVGELRSILDETTESPDPNEYSALEAASSFRVDCRWSNDSLDSYDVLFTPKNTSTHPATADKQAPTPDDPIKIDLHSLANQPLSSRAHRQLTQQLRDELREQLPAFMIPSAFVVMDELPTTVNGKVDRKALPPPVGRPSWAGNFVAPRNETEQAVAEIWEDLLDVRPVGVKDDFFDLGGHSMLAVRMIAEIDMTLGRQLPLGALFQDPTVAHLANMIEQGDDDDSASTLVTLRQVDSQQNQQTGTRSPLYCIHPAGGTVFCYLELAKHLSGDRSVLGLQARGIDGLYPPHDSLIEMAGFYADAIQQHASKQSAANIPLHIAGWSLGGNIAYEVARQLKDRGLPVGVVALLDSGLLSPETELTEEDFLPLLGALFPGAMNVPLEELRQQEPAKQLDFFVQRAATAGLIPTKEFDRAGNVLSVFQSNVKAVHQYQADSFDGDVHLFRPADQAKTSSLFDDPVLGWQQFVRKVTTLQVPGDHAHMLQSPAVEALACELSRILENYEANCSS
jgi:thioesterase domain-containing protein/acyl carrier protein